MSEFVVLPKRKNEAWISEFSTENLKLSLRIKNIIHVEKTPYQDLLIADSYEYGRVLLLDGAFQLTERDEFCYSEMMSHVALCSRVNPEKVLIIGGGDGAILREVMKHQNVKRCVLIDIDERVIECSKKYLPQQSVAFNDLRADVKCMDANKFIQDAGEKFDVVIIDSTDPVDFAATLFQAKFYDAVRKIMNDDGMLVELTESPFVDYKVMTQATKQMREVFPIVKNYWGAVPTYPSGMWTYGIASLKTDPSLPVREVQNTRYYTNEIHKASFILPPFLKELLS